VGKKGALFAATKDCERRKSWDSGNILVATYDVQLRQNTDVMQNALFGFKYLKSLSQ